MFKQLAKLIREKTHRVHCIECGKRLLPEEQFRDANGNGTCADCLHAGIDLELEARERAMFESEIRERQDQGETIPDWF